MSLLATLELVFWTGVYATLAGALAGVVAAVLWSPFLLSDRLRALFQLGPTDHWGLNYVVACVVVTAVHGLVLGVGLALGAGRDGPSIAVILLVSALTIGLVWAVPAVALPARGYEWDPRGFDAVTHLLLVGGSIWYAAIVTVPMFVLSLLLSLPA
ncbi:hypothetical protein ACFQJD_18845 [Haloplanus sp. GCM10025708]|uniref:hypothetical protein n=1 Tax=Haloferacaceae TaxID=1644056 RepID=UPI00361C819B